MPRHFPWLLALLGAASLLTAAWFVPIDFPRALEVPGRIQAAQEWMVTRDAAGRLTAQLRDHRAGAVVSFLTTEIERGDALEFTLADPVRTRGRVAAGDTVGRLSSSEIRQRVSRLAGELATSEALLQQTLSGEKPAVIDEAEQELQQAREQAALQERLVERQRTLAREQLLAPEALEQSETQLRLFQLGVAAAEARLEALRTGARPADVAFARARVQALRSELRTLEDRLARSVLTTPIAGTVIFPPARDTLLTVLDTSAPLVAFPLAWEASTVIALETPVRVAIEGAAARTGRIIAIHPSVERIQGAPYRLAIAELEPTATPLPPGLPVRCSIALPDEPMRTVVRQFVRAFFQS